MPNDPTSHIRRALHDHFDSFWPGHDKSLIRLEDHPITTTAPNFRVACIHPQSDDEPWAYLSIGGFELSHERSCGLEFLLLARDKSEHLAQTLALVASLHSQAPLRQGSVVDLQDPWIRGSEHRHLLVTLPYPYGPGLEYCTAGLYSLRILWLLPITQSEFELLKQDGVEALEAHFEQEGIDFLDPTRASVV
jgi:hypothetical protein